MDQRQPSMDEGQTTVHICSTCGAQYSPTDTEPSCCQICEDERQYVGNHGVQKWAKQSELLKLHENVFKTEEPDVVGIGTSPAFAIGQRALLIQTGSGNILWDCIDVLTGDAKEKIRQLGGIQAIAVSHPHYYTAMADWADAFGAPVHIHELDREWVTQPSDRIHYWTGNKLQLFGGVTLLRLGGHFPGSAVLHWDRGILCTGDTIQVIPDKGWVSFMYSYPNLIPLPAGQVARIRDTVKAWRFDRLYGAFFGRSIAGNAQDAVIRSADRYIGFLDGSEQRNFF